jgi:AAA+ ATPase superfamily predicted ATPase
MRVEEYRGVPFLYREKELSFLIEWFSESPQRILFVYGPKSSGKTTIIEYMIENKLLENNKHQYWLKYINIRRKFINNYKNFLDSFILPSDVYEEEIKKDRQIGIRVFKVSKSRIERIRRKEMDFSEALIEEVSEEKEKGKEPIIIVDEIQELRDVYIENGNNERQLLKKFLSFSVSLTKELHLSHVVILTSSTVFIERIYNDAKMKKTSEFMKINHLSKDEVYEWLGEIEGIRGKDIELIWEYVGGCIIDVYKVISKVRNNGISLREVLERERWLAYTEIVDYIGRGGFKDEEIEKFVNICKEITVKGAFELNVSDIADYVGIIDKWAEKEILFYDPLELKVMGNSRIYEKGMELLLERRRV